MSDPTRPKLLLTIPVAADHVELFDGRAYAMVGSDLRVFDLVSGEEVDSFSLGAGAVTDALARDGALLVGLVIRPNDVQSLRVLDLSGPSITERGSLALSQLQSAALFVAEGVAWIAAPPPFGLITVDISDPDFPQLISNPDQTNILGAAIALNGSGLGIVVGGSALIAGGLAQIGTTTLVYNTAIGFEGSQEVTSGTFVFAGLTGAPSFGGLPLLPGLEPIGNDVTLTLGKDVILRGGPGGIGENKFFFGTMSLVNRGTISADVDNQFLITQTSSLTNEGTIGTTGGGNFQFNDKTFSNSVQGKIVADGGGFQRVINLGGNNTQTWSNAGVISANNAVIAFMPETGPGSEGRWSNTGSILSQDAIVHLFGQFTSADVQNVQRSGGDIRIHGLMDNTGQNFTFNSLTGSYLLFGGTIRGGTLNMGGPAARLEIISSNSGNILDGVTINGDMELGIASRDAQVFVTNGLTLNGNVKIFDNTFNKMTFQGDQTVTGGTFVFEHPAGSFNTSLGIGLDATAGSTVTLDAGVNIRSHSVGGTILGKFVSYATITAEGNVSQFGSVALRGLGTDEFINRGTLRVNPGGDATGTTFVNEGTIIVDRARQFQLGQTWHNRGTIDVTSSLVILGGTFTTADIGDYRNPTGQTSLTGTLDNSGSKLMIDGSTGSWSLDGVLTGGAVRIVSGGDLVSNFGTLKDVAVEGDFAARSCAGG